MKITEVWKKYKKWHDIKFEIMKQADELWKYWQRGIKYRPSHKNENFKGRNAKFNASKLWLRKIIIFREKDIKE